MRLTIGNLLISGAMERAFSRHSYAGILARTRAKLNPPYAGRRVAAVAGYKVGDVKDARRHKTNSFPLSPCGRGCPSAARAGEGSLLSKTTTPHPARNSLRSFAPPSRTRGEGKSVTRPVCGDAPAPRR